MYDTEELVSHLDVRSLVNKWDNVKANFLNSGIHILTFSEIWLHSQFPDNLFHLSDDYTLLQKDRKWNDNNNTNAPPKKGGGVCTFISNSLDFSENSFATHNRSTFDIEIQWISV